MLDLLGGFLNGTTLGNALGNMLRSGSNLQIPKSAQAPSTALPGKSSGSTTNQKTTGNNFCGQGIWVYYIVLISLVIVLLMGVAAIVFNNKSIQEVVATGAKVAA